MSASNPAEPQDHDRTTPLLRRSVKRSRTAESGDDADDTPGKQKPPQQQKRDSWQDTPHAYPVKEIPDMANLGSLRHSEDSPILHPNTPRRNEISAAIAR